MPNAPARIALIGAGTMGALHARVIAQSDRARLARVIDPRAAAGKAVAERFDSTWEPSLDGLADVDAVVIAAATHAHHPLALAVLNAGLPVLIEKPLANDVTQAEDIVRVAEDRGIPVMCGFVERFNPAIQTVLSMINQPVHLIATRHSPYAPRIRTGVAWDLLIHDVDACLRLMGSEPAAVRGGLGYFHPVSDPAAEDVAEAVMHFHDGRIATASASRIGQRKIRTISVAEIDRSIEIDLLRRDVTVYRHVTHDTTLDGLGYRQQTIIEIPELVSVREPLAAQLDRFLDLVVGQLDPKEERESILPAHRVVAGVTHALSEMP